MILVTRVLVLLFSLGFAQIACGADSLAPKNFARPLISPIFGNHMVLQRDKPNSFWGWTSPGQTVRVTIEDHSAQTTANAEGRWQLSLDVPPAGGPYAVKIDSDQHVELTDILVGDVWLCGGQSNMLVALRQSTGGDEQVKSANRPKLRLYSVPTHVSYAPEAVPGGEWKVCSPETAAGFSAVAYHFAQTVQKEVDVPIGLIVSAVGGSPAESWISPESLARTGEFQDQVAKIAELKNSASKQHGSFLMHWLDENDIGGRGEAWARPGFDDQTWKTVNVPGGFNELGVPTDPAIVWFRREITLPDPLPAGPAKIFLGVVERMDTVYINGRWIGASSWVENPRVYTIPAGTLQPGKNVVAIRVFKTKPKGGFMSPPETLKLQTSDGHDVALAGSWRAALSFDAKPPAKLPLDFDNYPTMPVVLWNGMIAPLTPLAITGALWYQGEANSSRAQQYRKLMPALISDWRSHFGQGEFPFYIVGLPAFMARKTEPGTDGWASLREAQAVTVQQVRNTGLAVTIDTGEADNIHPKDKQPVGERLGRLALAGHYHRAVVASGPTLHHVEQRPGALALHFDHIESGLEVRGEKLGEFAVAGADRVWHWADARIEGNSVVVVTSSEVSSPLFARYAWQSNPLATLYNKAGLPAAPFRTDD